MSKIDRQMNRQMDLVYPYTVIKVWGDFAFDMEVGDDVMLDREVGEIAEFDVERGGFKACRQPGTALVFVRGSEEEN